MADKGDIRLDQIKTKMPVRKREDCEHGEQPKWVRFANKTRRASQHTREMRFASVHHHSTYSYLDGYALPEAHVRRATEIGMKAMALTEHGNVSSHVRFESAANKEGVKPLFGVELYCGPIDEDHRQQLKNHLTIIAEDVNGYRNMLRLVSKTYSEGFYYEPTASDPMLADHSQGVVVLSGCQSSLLGTSLVGGKGIEASAASYKRGLQVARWFKGVFGDAYYLEVQAFPELDETRLINEHIRRISQRLKIPMVASLDCHYTVPTEKELQKVLHNVRGGSRQTLEEMSRDWGYAVDLCPPVNDNAVLRRLMACGFSRKESINAILASEDIADRCTVELPSLPMLRYPLPKGYDSGQRLWRDWLRRGWEYRGVNRLSQAEQGRYKQRIRHEMKVIEDKDFVDYFLVVSDAVRWAKDHDIAVGPARGSAAGSLACWLLRITEVNPMLYEDLVFERFIDVTREDLPDIDLDFDSDRRNEVRDYLVGKYGRDCVNNMGTFSTYKSRLALDDVARVYKIPKWEAEKVKDVLIERSSGDLRASATIEDTVDQFDVAREVFEQYPNLGVAMDLEGNVKGFGVHAAGLVVSAGPITDVCAVYERKVKGETVNVVSMDKYDAEKKNLLKLDFLGLSNMTMINNCRLEMGWSLDELYNLPLDDELVINGFRENDVVGIFQFDGRAMRYVNGALRPDNFKELCDVNALARPGPLHNGAANEYIDIKMGRRSPELIHPAMEAITAATKFQVVYQEQILRILGEIGDFDWTHRAEVRRIISRKIGEQEFNRRWSRFYDGAKKLHDMDEDTARKIWGLCITAGSYAFNAAHAVSYTLLGYHTMWFKQHESTLYFQEMLKIASDEKQRVLLRDAGRGHERTGRKPLEIHGPHPTKSAITWTRNGKGLQAGFSQIPGIGPKMAPKIVEFRDEIEQEKHGLRAFGWGSLIDVDGIGPVTLDKMYEFVNQEDPFGAFWLDKVIAQVKQEIEEGKLGEGIPLPTHVAQDIPHERGQDIEVVWLGVIHQRNVRDLFEFNRAKTGVELDPKEVRDPHLNEWMVMVGDDESDQMGLRVDRWRYPKFRDQLWGMRLGEDLLLARGVKPGFMPTRQVWVKQLWIIDPEG